MLYQELLLNFAEKLEETQRETSSLIEEANNGIQLCNNTLSDLRRAVAMHGFESQHAEIHFFKNIKSEPLRFLIYYTEVRSCELKIPKWGLQAKFEFLEVETNRINSFFNHNLDFQLYMEDGRTSLDKRYFTRKYLSDCPLTASHRYFRDPLFNTSHDELWALVKGLGLYGNYLKEFNARIRLSNIRSESSQEKDPPFQFTLPPTAAMEFIYAFKELRAFNHGNFDIKPFTEYFCKVFDINIKDPYGLFAQITNRKTKRAKYIQMLLDSFLNFLERRDKYS